MSIALATPAGGETGDFEQRFVMSRVTWDAYVTISDALDDQPRREADLLRREVVAHGKIAAA